MRIDKMVTNLQRNDIEQFLHDVREYFIASLDTSEYENTSNMFHLTEAEQTANLLHRCNELLAQYTRSNQIAKNALSASFRNKNALTECSNGDCTPVVEEGDATYLDMSAANKKKSSSRECMMDLNTSTDSDKTFRCSTTIQTMAPKQRAVSVIASTEDERDANDREALKHNGNSKITRNDKGDQADEDVRDGERDANGCSDDERQIYDICLVSQMDDDDDDETRKVIGNTDSELTHQIDCPYIELPAGHLAIQQSSKYGQLQRIEKRLFFDQSKKCYCGILNDWLLMYAEGPTSSTPSVTLHLKGNGIEIEHYGEGKRRDICFQITTPDPNKKFVFQATNEVDAKEWIHAIEAAIRGDSATAAITNSTRKLPTPPVMKKLTFIGSGGNASAGNASSDNNNKHHTIVQSDCIYEEPTPLYAVHEPTELLLLDEKPPKKTTKDDKCNNTQLDFNRLNEYDIPKSPPQPVVATTTMETPATIVATTTDSESCGLLNGAKTPPKNSATQGARPDKPTLDFQAKVKDVHHKLSSQLTAGLSPERYQRHQAINKKSYSPCSNEMELIAFSSEASTPPKTGKDQKKAKKSDTPNAMGSPPRKNSAPANCEKTSKNWFLNRLNKNTSSTRNATTLSILSQPSKCKHSEKENLLNSLELCDQGESGDCQPLATNQNGNSSNPASPILHKGDAHGGKSKVNMIINQLEASGHLATMFSMDTFTTFCGGNASNTNDCNNYEPIMTMSTPTSLMKKV